MKEQIAKLNHLRIAPRKVRLVASALKGLSVSEAEAQLMTSAKRASIPLRKLLRGAVANAKQNQQLNPEVLFVKEIRVDKGPILKRFIARAMGRATGIEKKSSHITLVLTARETPTASRFTIQGQKAKKAPKKEIKKHDKEKPEPKEEMKKGPEKQGFAQKLFRRKAV